MIKVNFTIQVMVSNFLHSIWSDSDKTQRKSDSILRAISIDIYKMKIQKESDRIDVYIYLIILKDKRQWSNNEFQKAE